MADEHGPTFVLGQPALDQPRTYVIFGVSRGGTTMVAGVARMLGLDIGDGYGHTFEDPRFNMVRRVTDDETREQELDALRLRLRERNDRAEVWGWKYPNASRYLNDIRDDIRNPHLIVVCRDTAAVTARGRRPQEAVTSALRRNARVNLKNMRILDEWQVPSLVVSYERALADPLRFVTEMADFLGTDRPRDTAWYESFISPGYKPLVVSTEHRPTGP